MSTPAVRLLIDATVPHQLHTFDPGTSHFGDHAAAALAVDPGLILKTLIVDTGRGLATCCVPVPATLSLKKAAAALGVKSVSMADPGKAQRATGYVPGGISPLAQKRLLPTVIDASVEMQELVYISGGRRGLDIALDPGDLARLTGAQFSAISSA
ncbi:MAG: aminoacyl-tRNA deacylase [Corynebacterium sp.]|uniref:aminoacyl-tRNA deacylase n=1 Tax=Corynebacterium sp. TaxID=1720 RepID=UPI0026E0F627|nr:aminoacyl-tRNA deacylase [Corynebacterium sp.]MDO5669458.1 aminoacyl-tRNA deacylase [Corynebacterium sp.]